MKVIYIGGGGTARRDALLKSGADLILLGVDRWDDYDYKTTFTVECQMAGESVELSSIKILIEDQLTSYSYLDELLKKGWDGVFPIPDTKYISVPNALTFYEQIEGGLSLKVAIEVAIVLKDASYMVWLKEDSASRTLSETTGFRKSLQRERGSTTAYLDGWKIFNNDGIFVEDLKFRFQSHRGGRHTLNLRYDSKGVLPHDINVLIGPNGVGKSQLLLNMVKRWLTFEQGAENGEGFERSPNINQMIVVSYSPFERFPVDANDVPNPEEERRDHDVYRYFGLRDRREYHNKDGEAETRIRLSQSTPKANAANSLLDCVSDDVRYGAIKDWSAKLATMERVLQTAIDFDYAAVVVNRVDKDTIFFNHGKFWVGSDPILEISPPNDHPGYEPFVVIPIGSDRIGDLNVEVIRANLRAAEGIIFVKDKARVELSSGQRLFSYIVVNILGAIRRNSLILIDEPELFLHPTLEISFISMLKSILRSYRSKALLATHSLVTVRELPRDCVHVFDASGEELALKNPPFETFGGDIQRISSYVFGDKSVSKPFESWLREKLDEYHTAEALIEALGSNINEEMLIQIHAMENGQW